MRNQIGSNVMTLLLVFSVLIASVAAAQHGKAADTKEGFVTTADAVRIHYLEAGRGPAILFVPGWTMPAEIWEHQIAYFSKTHRVVAMDPRSQGRSSQLTEGHYPAARARDIKAVVDELNLSPVVVVGWSMGVPEVVAYVDQFGTDTLAGLVLVDGYAGLDFDPAFAKEFYSWVAGFQKDRRGATGKFVRSMYKKPQSEEYYQRIIRASIRTPTNTAMALLLGLIATDYRPALAKINKPTLIVVAQSPYQMIYEDMQKRISSSRLEVFEGAGHALFVDEPERFNTILEEFLKTAVW
ncbi:MAG: alpha/beta fold hydrolase [Terriglobia bacterium]